MELLWSLSGSGECSLRIAAIEKASGAVEKVDKRMCVLVAGGLLLDTL